MQQTITGEHVEPEKFKKQLETLRKEIQRLEQKTEKTTGQNSLPVYKKVERVGDYIGLTESDYTNSSDQYYKRPNSSGWNKILLWFRGNVEDFTE